MLNKGILRLGSLVLLSMTTASGADIFDYPVAGETAIRNDMAYHHFLPKDSTLGRGFEMRYDLGPKTKIRFEHYNTRNSNTDLHRGLVRSLDRRLLSNAFIFDWHPFGGNFRTSIGVVINQHRLDGLAFDDEQFVLKSRQQAGNDIVSLSATINFEKYAPYIGVGWTNNLQLQSNFHYSLDIGLMYHGRPDVRLHLSDPAGDIPALVSSQQISSLLREEEARIRTRFNDARIFPVISFGLYYRF